MSVTVLRKNPDWLRGVIGEYRTICAKEIACGFPRGKGAPYPDGQPVAAVAAAHVFGVGVPQRDFMTYSQPEVEKRSKAPLRKIVHQVNTGKDAGIPELMEAAGQAGAGAIKAGIVEGEYTPNASSTIAKKGSDRPLIDTGHMVQSVTHVVRDRQK